jgi:hypothetical protein
MSKTILIKVLIITSHQRKNLFQRLTVEMKLRKMKTNQISKKVIRKKKKIRRKIKNVRILMKVRMRINKNYLKFVRKMNGFICLVLSG